MRDVYQVAYLITPEDTLVHTIRAMISWLCVHEIPCELHAVDTEGCSK